jgi:hypothetical protein
MRRVTKKEKLISEEWGYFCDYTKAFDLEAFERGGIWKSLEKQLREDLQCLILSRA